VVLEGEVVVAILSPPPVWFELGVNRVSQKELNMAAQNEKVAKKLLLPLATSINHVSTLHNFLNCVPSSSGFRWLRLQNRFCGGYKIWKEHRQ
jgi:hypothetical protein